MNFIATLRQRWQQANTMVCVGLDPEPAKFPAHLRGRPDAVFEFCRDIVAATADTVCAFKPQIAHFAALGAEDALQRLVAHIHHQHPGVPVILDSKRGDIGSTASNYAIEAFDRYCADAVTVNPYLGRDSVQPFLDRADKGVVVLCRTSNPGSGEFQDLLVAGRPLYQRVAERVMQHWNGNGNCLLVVGATWPQELAQVRAIIGAMPLLIPGVGAQGGDAVATVKAGWRGVNKADGTAGDTAAPIIVNSSRAVLYASNGEDFVQAARREALRTRDVLVAAKQQASI